MATWAEELAVFLISFDFSYLSDLINCMKIWVFEVFQFQIVKSVFLLNWLHLIEDNVFVFCKLCVQFIIIAIQLTLHFPQFLASGEDAAPARSKSLGALSLGREIAQRQLLTATSARQQQFFLLSAGLLASNRPVLLPVFLSLLGWHWLGNQTLVLSLGHWLGALILQIHWREKFSETNLHLGS